MRAREGLKLAAAAAVMMGSISTARAQQPAEPATREAAIEQAQGEKSQNLRPYQISKGERLMGKVDSILNGTVRKWHPFFESAYSGGGFTLGAGYAQYLSPFNVLDVRASYSAANYKLAEAEFIAPRLFHRRGALSVVGGWREATQVPFYGIGTDTPNVTRFTFGFQRPYASALLTLRPTRRYLMLRGGLELTQWKEQRGQGSSPVDSGFTPVALPGIGIDVTYVHSQGTAGFDWRNSPGYARRGGFYGVTVHDYADRDNAFGFRQYDYEAIQHFPILREAWVISLHGLASTTSTSKGQLIPYFMLPALGSGHTLRGFDSFRFRDRNRLMVQAEWRIMVNRFMDTAFFYDAGKVTRSTADLDFQGLKSDFGFGARFHSPFTTPLRVEVAKSNEGLRFVLNTSHVF
jgi:hypothetical protein